MRRLKRRTAGISIDRTITPSGNIQNPTIGKNPKTPPKTNKTPTTMRSHFCFGILNFLLKIFNVDMVEFDLKNPFSVCMLPKGFSIH